MFPLDRNCSENQAQVVQPPIVRRRHSGEGAWTIPLVQVLELARPLTWSTRVRPICLPSLLPALTNTTVGGAHLHHPDYQAEGQGASIAGWGAINFRGPRSDTLLDVGLVSVMCDLWPNQGTVTVIGQQECATKLQSFRNSELG